MTARQDTAIGEIIDRFHQRYPRVHDDAALAAHLDQLAASLRVRFTDRGLDLDDPNIRRGALVALALVLDHVAHVELTCSLSIYLHSVVATAEAAYITIEEHHRPEVTP